MPAQTELAQLPGPWSVNGNAPRPHLLSSAPTPLGLLIALRRRWLLATGIGVACATVFATVAWILVPVRYEAIALLHVARMKPSWVYELPGEATWRDPKEYDSFRKTQIAQIKSSFVLTAALRAQDIIQLPLYLEHQDDPVSWLEDEILLTYPEDSEILQLSMRGEDPEQLAKLVNAVTDAYLRQVVNADRTERSDRLEQLQGIYDTAQKECESKMGTFKALATQTGAVDSEAVVTKQKLAFETLALLKRQLYDMNMAQMKAAANVLGFKAALEQAKKPSDTEMAYELEENKDPEIQGSLKSKLELKAILDQARAVTNRRDDPTIMQLTKRMEVVEEAIQERRAQLRPQIQQQLQGEQIKQLEIQMQAAETEQKMYADAVVKVAKEVEAQSTEVSKLGSSSAQLDSLKSQIEQLQDNTKKVMGQIQALKVELGAPNRVTQIQKADPPTENDQLLKFVLVTFATVFGFGLAVFGVSFWEFLARRVSSPAEIVDGLGMKMVGALPSLSDRSLRRLRSFGPLEGRALQGILAESVDSIRTTLLHSNGSEGTRVVMVTSAESQEGKTTLSSQLAASLARSGRRTLLIDGDLRRPAAHRLFELPLENGLCEVLRGEAEVDDVIRPTRVPGLWMIPAGRCDMDSIQALAKEPIHAVFARLKREFDFIVVDSGPVLSIADSLLLGQHVDAVILSLLRDVSQVAKVYEARERLNAVGIPVFGAVMCGVAGGADRRVHDLPLRATA
ncbi:MAG: polysaccharide biosynthesis tyrosine autokinase [Pirellulales bacterium]